MLKTFLPLMFLVVASLATLGCEDDVFLCEVPDSCEDQVQCFDICQTECVEGAFNLAGWECVFVVEQEVGDCFCECFVGCGVLE